MFSHQPGLLVCLQVQGPCGPIFTLPSPPPVPPPSVIGYHLPNTPFLNPLVPPHYMMSRPVTTLSGNVVSEVSFMKAYSGHGDTLTLTLVGDAL